MRLRIHLFKRKTHYNVFNRNSENPMKYRQIHTREIYRQESLKKRIKKKKIKKQMIRINKRIHE